MDTSYVAAWLAANTWGDRLVKTLDVSKPIEAVYLSREKLAWKRDDVINEAELVEALTNAGVTVIYPERLSIPEQVAIFRRAKIIFGQCGSAFHTSFFASQRPDQTFVIIVTASDAYSPNHALMDSANQNRSLYVHPEGKWIDRDGGKGFQINDPVAFAADLLQLVSSPLSVERGKLVNVGIGKKARQSSFSPFSHHGDEASGAISGVIPSDFAFHTDLEDNPAWQVDLKSSYNIKYIIIHNRVSLLQERAFGLIVETSMDGESWDKAYDGRGREFGSRGTYCGPLTIEFENQSLARFVKVSLSSRGYLHLAQIEILVPQAETGRLRWSSVSIGRALANR